MKIMFIYPDTGGRSLNYSPAIEILSAYLKQYGVRVGLVHLSGTSNVIGNAVPCDAYDEIYRRVSEFAPDVIGVAAITFQYPIACKVASALKERGFKNLILCGGIHSTIAPYDLKGSPFDGFVIGEGERTLVELIRRLEAGDNYCNIKGLNIKKGDNIIDNGYPEVIQDLDELPLWDYEIMNAKDILKLSNGWFSTAFSRGCPFACTFCINQKLKKDYLASQQGKYYRCQSATKAIGNLLSYIQMYPEIKVFNFDDDLLIMDKGWFKEFATAYREQIYKKTGIVYVINTRANFIDKEIVELLKSSGCYECQVGFETGNETLRNKVLSKGISNAQLKTAFNLFNKYGVRSLAYTMIGIPDESNESIEETLYMLSILKPTLIRMTFFEPYIGTPLYDYCIETGVFEDKFGNKDNFTKSTVKLKNISNRALLLYHLLFPWYLNLKLNTPFQKHFLSLINKYADMSDDDLVDSKVKQQVIDDDNAMDDQLNKDKIAHFCYYAKNTNYYQFKMGDDV